MSDRLSIHNNLVIWRSRGETVYLQPWGEDSIRVRATRSPEILEADWSLLPPVTGQANCWIDGDEAVMVNGDITVRIAHTGWIRFYRSDTGEVLLEERPHLRVRDFVSLDGGLYHIEARFKAYEGERFWGLGQHKHGFLDQKGCVIELQQENSEVCIPFLVSSRGYGFLWHNPAVGRVELGNNQTRWVANKAAQIDYWVTAGDTPAEILAHYADATGHAPVLPEWASGFWQCKLRYRTQEELLNVAREYKRRGLPLSVIVIDYFHWPMMGDWRFDPVCWPDPDAMVKELEEMGVKLMVSIWPSVNPGSVNYGEMHERGFLIGSERGIPAHLRIKDNKPDQPVDVQYYDAMNPDARQFIWQQVCDHYYRHGIKVWWLDACEPEILPTDFGHLRYFLGNGEVVGNIYPQMHQRAFYDGMRGEGETEIVTLCRSAWSGSQRYGAAVWSGDIPSTFESLQQQVRAGLNMAMSGIPWWTTDIGGFYGGHIEDPGFRELVVRWFQYGTFCPLFRLHGVRLPEAEQSGAPNEVWSFGEEAYEIIRGLLFLRERLRPYIQQQMQIAATQGLPPMRPLLVDFPDDPQAVSVDDQFMFGPDLLIAPVLRAGATSRQVYLPAGTTWTDPWMKEQLDGGQWITADAPLAKIPLYLRGEARLPIGE